MRKNLLIVLILLSATFMLSAQADPNWYIGKPISDIQFKGLYNVSIGELEGIFLEYLDKEFESSLFDELYTKLYETGYFKSITPQAVQSDEGDLVILFEIIEKPVIGSVEFRGNMKLSKTDLKDQIVLKIGDFHANRDVLAAENALKEFYREKGFIYTEIDVEAIETDGRMNIVFVINEGSQAIVREIFFSGNNFVSDSTLESILQTKRAFLFEQGLFRKENLDADKALVLDYYASLGYINAQVIDIVEENTEDAEKRENNINLTYYIEEGEQYYFGGIEINGNNVFTDEELLSKLRLKEGDLFDKSLFVEAYSHITGLYFENGYIRNQFNDVPSIDEENNIVSFTLDIVEAPRSHVEFIEISSAEPLKTEEAVILREIPIEPGEVFSRSKLVLGINNLRNTGIFTNVMPNLVPGTSEDLLGIILTVEEGNTIDLKAGVSFGGNSDFPVALTLAWTDRNFLGKGLTFGVDGTASPIEQSVAVKYTDRWFGGGPLSLGFNVNFSHEIMKNVAQDIMFPIFQDGDDNAVPDPFTGEWVYADTGALYEGTPTDAEIEDGTVMTDYEYARYKGLNIPSDYTMEYDEYSFGGGINMGYRFQTPLGTLTPSGGINFEFTNVDYDANLYRPFDELIRENKGVWEFTNTLTIGLTLDSRDYTANPTSGYLASQKFNYTGGLLYGTRHYIKSTSKAEFYHTLFEHYASKDYTFQLVLAAHTELGLILPQYQVWEDNPEWDVVADSNDKLRIDGFIVGRAQESKLELESLWLSWIELRMPIVQQIIWTDLFFEAMASKKELSVDYNYTDWNFSLGADIRLVMPQFPIKLYLAKRFTADENGINWIDGNISDLGLDFGISFQFDF